MMCVCVCFLPIFSESQVRWMYQPGSHRKVTQNFSSTFLLRCMRLNFLARRIQPFVSLVDREVEFCVLTISSFSTCWAFIYLFIYLSPILVTCQLPPVELCMVTHIPRVFQPGKLANPAGGQLNRKNEYFPVRVRA